MLNQKIISIKGVSRTHLVRPTSEQIQQLAEKYDLHDLIVEDVEDARVQDKIDVYDDHIFIVFHFPKYDSVRNRYYANEFNIIIGRDYLISFTNYETSHIKAVRTEYRENIEDMEKDEKFKASPYFVLYTMIDVMYDKMMLALTKFQRDLAALEDNIFDDSSLKISLLEQLLIKRRNSVVLKHMIFPQKEILTVLHTLTDTLYDGELDVYFEDLESKFDRVRRMIAIVNETTTSLSDTYGDLATVQTNKAVSALTIYTVVIGVMTLITGFYGMNVSLPGQHNDMIVWIVVIVMMISGIGLLVWSKKKGRG